MGVTKKEMVDLWVVFLLYVLLQWTAVRGRGRQTSQNTQVDKAYIRELKKELAHYQANSAFVVRTLLEREVGRVEDSLAQQKPMASVSWNTRLSEVCIQALVGAFITWMWWNVALYSFWPEEESGSVLVCAGGEASCVQEGRPWPSLPDSPALQAMLYGLSLPHAPMGSVGIVGWSLVCRLV